jgi:hypothetical protein
MATIAPHGVVRAAESMMREASNVIR